MLKHHWYSLILTTDVHRQSHGAGGADPEFEYCSAFVKL